MTRRRYSFVQDEIEVLSGRRVDFENLECLRATIGKRMLRSSRNVDHVILANHIGFLFDRERALPASDDIDVVRVCVVVQPAAWRSRGEPIEVDIHLLGAESRVDQLDLLTAPASHRGSRTLAYVEDFEHARCPPCPPWGGMQY